MQNGQATTAAANRVPLAAPQPQYEPPVLTPVGNLRDVLLQVKSGPRTDPDPGPGQPVRKP